MTTAALDATVLEALVAAAVAAPSIHNTQPWRFRFDPGTGTLHVRAAADRSLRHHDPTGRALHISVGAAVFNLRVAVQRFGREPVVRLLPRPSDPALLATVRLAGPHSADRRAGHDLYDAVWRRHSSRRPFSDTAIPADDLAAIAEAAAAEGALLDFPPPAEASRVLHLTAEAELMDATDPERSAESRIWARDGSDGVPDAAFTVQDSEGRMPMRDFAAHSPGHPHTRMAFERHPRLAVLSTPHDTRADWLRAGQGLEHALLVATTLDVKASMFSQATEWPDLRWTLRDPRGGSGHVQMLIRFGYGPDGPAAPRRPVREVLEGMPGRS